MVSFEEKTSKDIGDALLCEYKEKEEARMLGDKITPKNDMKTNRVW